MLSINTQGGVMNKTTFQIIATVLVISIFLPCFIVAQDYKKTNLVII